VPPGLESGNVMKLGVERALSGLKNSNSRAGSMPFPLRRLTERSNKPKDAEYGSKEMP
jgi:hypothetical protein